MELDAECVKTLERRLAELEKENQFLLIQAEVYQTVIKNSQNLKNGHKKIGFSRSELIVDAVLERISNQAKFTSLPNLVSLINNVIISFTPNVNKTVISSFALEFLKDTLSRSGNTKATITSSARTPEEQATVMFNNIELKGVESQKALYSNAGDQVIDVFIELEKEGKNRQEIIAAMVNKINEIGPSKVSRHCSDFTKLVVIDVAPSSIVNKEPWITVLEEMMHTFPGFNFIPPGNDPAFHLEIPNTVLDGKVV